MNDTSNKANLVKKEIDYFYILIKNWKTIFLVSFLFVFISLIALVISPNPHTSKSSFSVSLKNKINTSYGTYKFISLNPLHYLSIINLSQFKDSVLNKAAYKSSANIKIEEEKVIMVPNSLEPIYSSKFDFIVSGNEVDHLEDINNFAYSMFLENMDRKIQDDMYNQFSSELKIQIDSIDFAIQIKEKLVKELRETLKDGVQLQTDKFKYKDLVDDRLINSLDGSERGLIISIMLNGDKGNQYYQSIMLSVEEVQLKISRNNKEKTELLLNKLNMNKEEGTLSNLFNLPFSSNCFMLTPPEIQKNSEIGRYVKQSIAFFLLGFFISSTVVLGRSYYTLKLK